MIKIFEANERPAVLVQKLLQMWEKSVRKTHLFLSDEEVKAIKNYMPQALSGIVHLLIVENEAGINKKLLTYFHGTDILNHIQNTIVYKFC